MTLHTAAGAPTPSSSNSYTSQNPLPILEWQRISDSMDVAEQGSALAEILFRDRNLCVVSQDALDNLPREVVEGLHLILHRRSGNTGGVERILPHAPAPNSPIPAFPQSLTSNDRSFSIISGAVDHSLTWHLVLMIQDPRGACLGPSLAGREGLAFAPIALHHDKHFIGVYIQMKSTRVSEDDSVSRDRVVWEQTLLLSPVLEQDSLRNTGFSSGKLRDIAVEVCNRAFSPTNGDVRLVAKTFPRERSFWMLVESARDTGGSVVVEYTQQHGVLGDYSAFGPFTPFTPSVEHALTHGAHARSLEDRLGSLKQAYDSLVLHESAYPHLVPWVRDAASKALVQNGYAQLPQEQSLSINQIQLLAHDRKQNTADFDIIVSVKEDGLSVVPSLSATPLRFASPEALIFSLRVYNTKGQGPAQIVYNALKEIARCSSSEVPGEYNVEYSGLLLTPSAFSATLAELASIEPERSPWHSILVNSIDHIFSAKLNATSSPTWFGVNFETEKDLEDDYQRVSLLIRHSHGFSRFQITRHKDSGLVSLPTNFAPGGIAHLSSVPLGSVQP